MADGNMSGVATRQMASGIDRAIDDALADRRIVGCVVLVAEHGGIVHARAGGYADREAGRPTTIDTPFRLASLTKPFTTMTALKLVEAGSLSLDAPVVQYLPTFRPEGPDGQPADIRVSHLMTHTAGLDYRFQQPADGAYAAAGVSDGLDEVSTSQAENLARIASVPLMTEPGLSWRYSVATDVLGGVIEAVAGCDLPAAVEATVLQPLDLGARFSWDESELATAYQDGPDGPIRMGTSVEIPLPFGPGAGVRFGPRRIASERSFPSGGAGMASRAMDVLRVLEAYRAPGFLDDRLRNMALSALVDESAQAQGPGWGYGMAGSVLIDPVAAGLGLSPGTVSWGGVYGSWWAIDRARGRTIVAVTNTAYEGMIGQFARDIAAAASA